MLIKAAEPPPQILQLQSLLERDDITLERRMWIERELRTTQAGYRGEKQAAFKLEFHFKARTDVATIHGLRVECAGRSAQIDHLVISRYLDIWICESKAFTGRVDINDHAEWQVTYRDRSIGIESPVSQARKHQYVLAEVLERGLAVIPASAARDQVRLHLAVLFSDRARIDRPDPKTEMLKAELAPVVKIERFYAMFEDLERQRAAAHALTAAELAGFARALTALHTPATVDWSARFGLPRAPLGPATQLKLPLSLPQSNKVDRAAATCASCRIRLSTGEVRYCQTQFRAFGNRLYCFRCQPAARAAAN